MKLGALVFSAGLLCLGSTEIAVGAPLNQTALEAARGALSQSNFQEAMIQADRITDVAQQARVRMDTLYAAGDLAGALDQANRVSGLEPDHPHGPFMASRLALDLGLEQRGLSALDAFEQRMVGAEALLGKQAYAWYADKARALNEQATSQLHQASMERTALFRARLLVAFTALLIAGYGPMASRVRRTNLGR